jgi:hypothetical protein
MNNASRSSHAFVAAALLALAVPAFAQQKAAPSLKTALAGTTWAVVSADGADAKGQKRGIVEGKNVGGQLMLGNNGRYSYTLLAEMPKLAKDRLSATPAEDRMVSQGVLTHYGTYTIDEKERMLVMNIERSSFPNQNGQVSKRAVTMKGGELVLDNPARMTGGTTHVVLKKL